MTLSIVLAFGLFLGLIVFLGLIARSLAMLGKRVPGEDREYLDPLSTALRVLWPLVRFLDFHFGRLYPPGIVKRVELQLQLTGRSYLLSARQFISLSLVAAAIALIMALLVARWLGSSSPTFPLAAALLGSLLPRLWLRDIRARTVKQVEKQLPVYLDFLTLSMEAGLNLNGSLTQAVSKGPSGPLKREFEHVLRDLKSGLPRADALRRMDDRLQIREVTNFVSSVVQSERMGGSIATTLRFQSEQRRTERFQRAEKQAMEAPVKLIFPLVVFIFPVTFIVLGFPIVMKFMQEGAAVKTARIAAAGEPLALDLNVTTGMFDRLKGWMGRRSIAERDALLIEPCNSVHTWFMHAPIDVVFIDRARRIVSVRDNVGPRRLCSHWRAAAVLELQAGRRQALGLAPGMQLEIEAGGR